MADALTPDTLAAASAATLAADLAAVETTLTSGALATLDVATIDDTDSPFAVTSDNAVVLVDAASGPVVVALPAAASVAGRVYHVKRIDSAINAVTVDPDGAETIDGAATLDVAVQWENVTVASTGAEWVIL